MESLATTTNARRDSTMTIISQVARNAVRSVRSAKAPLISNVKRDALTLISRYPILHLQRYFNAYPAQKSPVKIRSLRAHTMTRRSTAMKFAGTASTWESMTAMMVIALTKMGVLPTAESKETTSVGVALLKPRIFARRLSQFKVMSQ